MELDSQDSVVPPQAHLAYAHMFMDLPEAELEQGLRVCNNRRVTTVQAHLYSQELQAQALLSGKPLDQFIPVARMLLDHRGELFSRGAVSD